MGMDNAIREDGIPTRVGVDRPWAVTWCNMSRYPHTRGGGPIRLGPYFWASLVSPHAWGWTIIGQPLQATRLGYPHTRGGGPAGAAVARAGDAVSPHAWGWTGLRRWPSPMTQGIPTRVGVDRMAQREVTAAVRYPHTRGGGPRDANERQGRGQVSPHAWGWTASRAQIAARATGIPTRVGVDRPRPSAGLAHARYPHTRGGGPTYLAAILTAAGVSPHAWGWTGAGGPPRIADRGIPTRVGVDRRSGQMASAVSWYPHTRGGGPPEMRAERGDNLVSPHAWGWTIAARATHRRASGIPTRVGVDLPRLAVRSQAERYPHTRGGGPCVYLPQTMTTTVSPHAWGWTAPTTG